VRVGKMERIIMRIKQKSNSSEGWNWGRDDEE
jgi:hypothetical protein